MSLVKNIDQIEYPESDGKPMGETDLHRDWMVRILEIMRYRYRGQRVYIASDLLVYYEEGEPKKFVVPDDFVVRDCDPGRRRTFKIWEEGKSPEVVFEVTSRSSRRKDQSWKSQVYFQIGVLEYFLYDPTSDYLDPPLRGYRRGARGFEMITPTTAGVIECQTLGIHLTLDDGQLVMHDAQTGAILLTHGEAVEPDRAVADAALRVADAARFAAEQRTEELEAEIRRLQDELARKPRDSPN